MTNTITVSNKELVITKVGETFTEGAFEVSYNKQVVFSAPTNKSCVMFLAKNKEIEIDGTEEVVTEEVVTGITRTGAKMLTVEEEVAMGYSVRKEVISAFITKNDKDKDILVELDSTGTFSYHQLVDGKRFGKKYFLNTPKFKYVREDNKHYKAKLPKWITAEELNAMY